MDTASENSIQCSDEDGSTRVILFSMLTELVKGRKAAEVAAMSKDEVLEDMPPLTPVRLKCALLGLKTLKAGVYGIDRWPGEEEDA